MKRKAFFYSGLAISLSFPLPPSLPPPASLPPSFSLSLYFVQNMEDQFHVQHQYKEYAILFIFVCAKEYQDK